MEMVRLSSESRATIPSRISDILYFVLSLSETLYFIVSITCAAVTAACGVGELLCSDNAIRQEYSNSLGISRRLHISLAVVNSCES